MVLPWLAAAWLCGIAAATALPLNTAQWLALAALSAAATYATRREQRARLAFACVTFLALGCARSTSELGRRASASVAASGRPATVQVAGVVGGPPSFQAQHTVFDLESTSESSDGAEARSVAGVVRVFAPPGLPIRRGETVVVIGRIRPPRERDRLEVSAQMEADEVQRMAPPPAGFQTRLDEARATVVRRLHAILPDAEASLIAGVLLGVEETMPAPLLEAFRQTGTAHILVVSGFNVTIVAAASLALLGGLLGARRGAAAAGLSILLYTLLVGGDPPVARAAIMAGIVLLAARLGRQPDALAALAAAALLMSLVHPAVVFDVGFQLSFLATLGLVVAARPLSERFRAWVDHRIRLDSVRPALVVLGETTIVTLVAQLATLPISVYTFGRLPLTALPANALILPAQPPLMATGAVTALASLIDVRLGALAAWLAWPFAAYTIRVTELFASLPGASLELPPLPWIVPLGLYGSLLGVLVLWRQPRARAALGFVRRIGWAPPLLALGALTMATWKLAFDRPDGRLSVTALPAGAVLIQTPDGRFAAVSGSSGQVGLRAALDSQLPLTYPRLDWLVLAHPEASAEEAIRSLGRFSPGGFLAPAGAAPPAEAGGPAAFIPARAGSVLDLGDGATLEIVEAGAAGLYARVTFGDARLLVLDPSRLGSSHAARDLPGATAVILLGAGRRVAAALRSEWPAPAPRVVVGCPIPGEPLPEGALRAGAPTRLTTQRNGWIRLTTDGRTLEVHAERNP